MIVKTTYGVSQQAKSQSGTLTDWADSSNLKNVNL